MQKIILAAALGATMLTGAASAQSSVPTAQQPAPVAQTPRPMPHIGRGMGAGALLRADLNHDGVVTRAEAIADAERRFAAMDADRNGTVTSDERRAAMANMREKRAERHGDDAPPPPAPGANRPDVSGDMGFAGRGRGMGGNRGDRDMTQGEFRDRATRMFDRVDTNHNGQVDANEIEAARLLMRARMSGNDAPAPRPAPADNQ